VIIPCPGPDVEPKPGNTSTGNDHNRRRKEGKVLILKGFCSLEIMLLRYPATLCVFSLITYYVNLVNFFLYFFNASTVFFFSLLTMYQL